MARYPQCKFYIKGEGCSHKQAPNPYHSRCLGKDVCDAWKDEIQQQATEKMTKTKRNRVHRALDRINDALGRINEGLSELKTIVDEIEEARDNMSGTNLENTERYQRYNEAVNVLRQVCDDIESAMRKAEGVDL